MQKCEGCGAYFSDFDKVCPHCGRETEPSAVTEENTARTAADIPTVNPAPENIKPENMQGNLPGDMQRNQYGGYVPPFVPPAVQSPYPMKWHNFLMFIMILGPVISIVNGFTLLIQPESVLDFLLSLSAIAISVFALYVRNRMYRFRKDSPRLLLIYYAVSAAVNALNVVTMKDDFIRLFGAGYYRTLLVTIVIMYTILILVNRSYYEKRRELFNK